MSLVPSKVFFVKGHGFHKNKLAAFEEALREAGIERFNLVTVSSILPPYCIEIPKEKGLKQCSYQSYHSSNKTRLIVAVSVSRSYLCITFRDILSHSEQIIIIGFTNTRLRELNLVLLLFLI